MLCVGFNRFFFVQALTVKLAGSAETRNEVKVFAAILQHSGREALHLVAQHFLFIWVLVNPKENQLTGLYSCAFCLCRLGNFLLNRAAFQAGEVAALCLNFLKQCKRFAGDGLGE